jgi:cellulose synthase/poly-beta-1,6-N-acetylglucosamine synthase-like glycosyltransferase
LERYSVKSSSAETGDEPLHPTAAVAQVTACLLTRELSADERPLSICVACCSTASLPHDTALAVAKAFAPLASVRTVLLSETEETLPDGAEVAVVPRGTKLSKIRWLAGRISADLLCICDPDLTIDEESCRVVLGRAAADLRDGQEVVAFGIVEGRDDGTVLSQVIAMDKWVSHRILRRLLWAAGVGVTLPGQFLIVSTGFLRSLNPAVDSYLDDLYLGWVARRQKVRVHRVPVVVGLEEPRSAWSSLLTQRVRWMRGLARLFGHLAMCPSAVFLLSIHYLAYHGLPIFTLLAILSLVLVNPIVSLGVFFGLTVILAVLSRRSFLTAATFLAVFPVVHVLATLLWWVPVSRTLLTRR